MELGKITRVVNLDLNSLTLWQRIFLSAGIVLAVFLILLAITRMFGDAEAQQQRSAAQPIVQEECVVNDEEVDRIRALMFVAIDEAFKEQIKHLFDVWMRDYRKQPENTLTGGRNAVNARITSHVRIEKWNPPRC